MVARIFGAHEHQNFRPRPTTDPSASSVRGTFGALESGINTAALPGSGCSFFIDISFVPSKPGFGNDPATCSNEAGMSNSYLVPEDVSSPRAKSTLNRSACKLGLTRNRSPRMSMGGVR